MTICYSRMENKIIETTMDYIGFLGPVLLFFNALFFLKNQYKYRNFFLISFFLNIGLNKVLKLIIREPRPSNYIFFHNYELYKNEEMFGMPSGHAQVVFFSTIYLFLVKSNVYVLIISLFVCALTLYQRFKYRRHTVSQLFYGSITGSLFAGVAYYLANRSIHFTKNNNLGL